MLMAPQGAPCNVALILLLRPQVSVSTGGRRRRGKNRFKRSGFLRFFGFYFNFCFIFQRFIVTGAVIGRQLLRQMLGRKAVADGKQLCEGDKGRKKKKKVEWKHQRGES